MKEMERLSKKSRKTSGITLIALVVTIVVLIILATISINAVFGENGIIKRAEAAKRLHEQGVTDEQEGLNQLDQYLGDKLNDVPEAPITPDTPKGPNGKPLVNKDTVNKTEHDKVVGEDKLGNPVIVPNGFRVPEESGETIEDGIIIEDSIGNQFVWVPVSNIDGDGIVNNQDASGLITRKDGSKVQITLGRYSFADNDAEEPGKPTLVQKGSEYAAITDESDLNEAYKIKGFANYYTYELAISRESNYKEDSTGKNATAKNLKGFIESVKNNHGYYIARYEASFGSGEQPNASEIDTENYITNQKPLSKPSIVHTRTSSTDTLTEGMLWNYINQGNASKASRNMYEGNSYVESDLVNSYMRDTVIVYIQAMGNANYVNANRDTVGNSSLLDTGKTGDEKCHIYDIAGNLAEWTTEYSTDTRSRGVTPCVIRGGDCERSDFYPSTRHSSYTLENYGDNSFRVGLYIK